MHHRAVTTALVAALLVAPATAGGLVQASGAAAASGHRYSVRVANSGAGGDPRFFYVGGPLNVTVTDRLGKPAALRLCLTPAPIDRRSCHDGSVGRTIDSVAPSKAGLTKLRVTIGRTVIVRVIRVRRSASASAAVAGPPVYGPPVALANPQAGVLNLTAQWTTSPPGSFVVTWYAQGAPGNDGYLFGARGPFTAGAAPTRLLGPARQTTTFAGYPWPAVGVRSTGAVVAAARIGTAPGAHLGTSAGAITGPLPAARSPAVTGTVQDVVLGMRADGGTVIAASACPTASCGRRMISLVTRSNTGQLARPVTITGGGIARPVVIAVNARGDAFIAWVRGNRVEGRLRTAGGSVGPVASLGPAKNRVAPLALTISAQRRVVVAWEDQTVGSGSVVSSDAVFYVTVSADGRRFGSATKLETQTDRVRTPGPGVVTTQVSDGATWVGWTGRTDGRFVVRAVRVNSAGPGSTTTPSTTTTADASIRDIAGGERHSLAVVWVETPHGPPRPESAVVASVQRSEYAPWSAPETVAGTTGVFAEEQQPVVTIEPGTRTALFAWTQNPTPTGGIQGEQPVTRTRTIP